LLETVLMTQRILVVDDDEATLSSLKALRRVRDERGRVQGQRRPSVSALSGPVSLRRVSIARLSPLLIEPDVQFSRIRLSDGFHTPACAGDPR
jgi:hypothetical protein